ncbi:MAG: 4-(cytidine 5'-diphospho)-2-C-methyl-D-erythritol kinase [Armatimonadetes bacterium]|nr:4-(cytidine 5'-diphospho)-2-C-methyl-D-erythritol kinase [Armatimonadota bacterium]
MPDYLSPAKINLTLDILGRRPDGYHNLESVAAAVGLHDIITLRPQPEKIALTCSAPYLPCDARNLAYRAAELLRSHASLPELGVSIHIEKRIPAQAGLGGGSGNAATMLRALNELWELRWPLDRLLPIAALLGSDVPFFLFGGTALLQGRGERVSPLGSRASLSLALVRPDFGISTAWAYGQLPQKRSPRRSAETMRQALASGDPLQVGEALHNDFDAVACAAFPALRRIHDRLRQLGAAGSLLCGSGSAVFGLFPDIEAAARAAATLACDYPFACAARTEDMRHDTLSAR